LLKIINIGQEVIQKIKVARFLLRHGVEHILTAAID